MPSASVKVDKHEQPMATQQYADYFELSQQKIEQSRQHKITVVHHNAHGQIIDLE